eukprot:2687870-Rhodomonas_salina.3
MMWPSQYQIRISRGVRSGTSWRIHNRYGMLLWHLRYDDFVSRYGRYAYHDASPLQYYSILLLTTRLSFARSIADSGVGTASLRASPPDPKPAPRNAGSAQMNRGSAAINGGRVAKSEAQTEKEEHE